MVTTTNTIITITAVDTIAVFPTYTDAINWVCGGAKYDFVHNYNGMTLPAIAGTYSITAYTSVGFDCVYIKQYPFLQSHPKVPFPYHAWAVVR